MVHELYGGSEQPDNAKPQDFKTDKIGLPHSIARYSTTQA